MKRTVFSALSSLRRVLRRLGLARLIIRVPYVSRLFWFVYHRLRPQDIALVTMQDFGFRMYVDPRDQTISCTLLMLGHYEPFASQVFNSLLREGMTVVDIGAHVGYYTLLAAKGVGASGRVFSFEPEPRNFGLLCRNISLNALANVFPQQKALLDRDGTHHFYLAAEAFGSHGIYRQDATAGRIEVETTTLDELFSGRTETVQVIKMDAEGAEPLILKGMKDVISRCDKLALLTEFFPPNLRAGGHPPEAYLTDLAGHGFVLYLLDEEQRRVTRMLPRQLIEICAAQPGPVRNLLCLKNMEA